MTKMWNGVTMTTTEATFTLYVTNIPDDADVNEVCGLFDQDDGFLCFRPVGGGNKRRMAFVDFDATQLAAKSMRKHQNHKLPGVTDAMGGLAIDFDKDPRSKRSKAMEKNWGHGENSKIQGGWAAGGGGGNWVAGTVQKDSDDEAAGDKAGGQGGKSAGKGGRSFGKGKGKGKGKAKKGKKGKNWVNLKEKEEKYWKTAQAEKHWRDDAKQPQVSFGEKKEKVKRALPSHLQFNKKKKIKIGEETNEDEVQDCAAPALGSDVDMSAVESNESSKEQSVKSAIRDESGLPLAQQAAPTGIGGLLGGYGSSESEDEDEEEEEDEEAAKAADGARRAAMAAMAKMRAKAKPESVAKTPNDESSSSAAVQNKPSQKEKDRKNTEKKGRGNSNEGFYSADEGGDQEEEDHDETVGEDGIKYTEAEWIAWQLEQDGDVPDPSQHSSSKLKSATNQSVSPTRDSPTKEVKSSARSTKSPAKVNESDDDLLFVGEVKSKIVDIL